MSRLLFLIPFLLAGCAGPEGGFGSLSASWPFAPQKAHAALNRGASMSGGHAQFSFEWQLSGDAEIMPLQVFDDGRSMWLQFPPEGAWPAVFESTANGLRPLTYRREAPYMVLDSVHEQLELRGGHLRGLVKRPGGGAVVGASVSHASLQPRPGSVSAPVAAQESVSAPALVVAQEPVSASLPVPGTTITPVAETGVLAEAWPDAAPELVQVSVRNATFLGAPLSRYAVSPADVTMRQALERWARTADWTFSAEHWAVDVDIPLVGEAGFETDFKSAVRELLAATEMGDRPLQPCFYSNRVLRVVPHAQACDRRGVARAAS